VQRRVTVGIEKFDGGRILSDCLEKVLFRWSHFLTGQHVQKRCVAVLEELKRKELLTILEGLDECGISFEDE